MKRVAPHLLASTIPCGQWVPLAFASNVVERLKEFIPIWGPGDTVSQVAKASTCHSPPVWCIFLAASDYGVISRGLCGD